MVWLLVEKEEVSNWKDYTNGHVYSFFDDLLSGYCTAQLPELIKTLGEAKNIFGYGGNHVGGGVAN